MSLLAQELLSRLIPISQRECAYARNRLPEERNPWPKVGDFLFFRRNEWDTDADLYRMRVVDVQSEDDTTSEFSQNLWQQLVHPITGHPQFFPDGNPVIVPMPDPWPWVKFVWDGELPTIHEESWKFQPQITFESRLRGSPGWLPLDYAEKRVTYLVGSIPYAQLPAYRFNGSFVEVDRGDGIWLPFLRK